MEDNKPSDNSILEQLRNGFARFELVSSPTPSVSGSIPSSPLSASFFGATTGNSYAFFARIGTPLNRSPAAKKAEHYSVDRVTGDGRCLFRALVKGMAFNKGLRLNPRQERDDADELRMAVKEVMCDDAKEREKYEEAVVAITVDESLKRYCQRIRRQDFWGGESELLVSSENPFIVSSAFAIDFLLMLGFLIFNRFFPSYVSSPLSSTYPSTSTGREDSGRVLSPLQSMEQSSGEVGVKERPRTLLGFFTVVETIMICFADESLSDSCRFD
ncbi:PREDICTED: uncharacterized protein LOC104805753 isoform X2 [Tarenaya hassleriana]|uniref:uncharacterized protein LOC104805753 isoform X2 n=1 Tax=Tarenaya hassleriana TaxID=28532 RepID=UPI00053C6880|nr:PREDICTED: uncharacterized protein LOC104805753 isoform X2 [Tarenaya hassleriana]